MSQNCCVDGCGRPGTVSANHPGASLYCAEHGICGRCGESVEFFTFCEERGIFMCPCRHKAPQPIPVSSKEQSRIAAYWSRSNSSVSH